MRGCNSSMGALLGLCGVGTHSVTGAGRPPSCSLALVPAYPAAVVSSLRRERLPALASAGAGYFFS